MKTTRIYTRKVIGAMWASGQPSSDGRFAAIHRAAIKAGLDERQASALVRLAYDAAHRYTFNLPTGSHIHLATQARNAVENPNSKDAEDLAAACEGRPSRWGTVEFHRA